ncbi:armadillo-type protein [Fimicolochytrium jonesii]|uniref:armadillo-type protein n=1 Tax=Fimicolochytrium jonesii TaxID=1396493 RepID=UPI0022FECC51|nr:armadillo-type protein [Fimicolochytrium jonesii]KAI8816698.1 armadillo-type protein [Fimicolochytrium jonesii]
MEQYDEALKDIKVALTIDRQYRPAVDAMRELLETITKNKKLATDASPTALLRTATTLEGEDADWRGALDAAEKLVVLSADADGSERLLKEGGVDLLLPALFAIRTKPNDHRSKLVAAYLKIIANISHTGEGGFVRILSFISKDTAEAFLGEPGVDAPNDTLAIDIASTLILKVGATLESEPPNIRPNAHILLDAIVRHLDPRWPVDHRAATFGALIKAVSNEEFALAVINNTAKGNTSLFSLVSDPDERIRNLVPVALARILELIAETNQKAVQEACRQEIVKRVDSDSAQTKALGLQALNALFQASFVYGSSILCHPGFLDSFMDTIDFEPAETQLALLETLSAACADKESRTLIVGRCSGYLQKMTRTKDARLSATANVVASKLATASRGAQAGQVVEMDSIPSADSFIATLEDTTSPRDQDTRAVEGLAYLTIEPRVKEHVVTTKGSSLKGILTRTQSQDFRALHYGLATMIANLTAFRQKATEEEEQVRKLRRMAKDASLAKPGPDEALNDEDRVRRRCEILVLQCAMVPWLISVARKSNSTGLRKVTAQIFCNLATNRKLHNVLVQQGAVRILLEFTRPIQSSAQSAGSSKTSPSTSLPTPPADGTAFLASHALAKIAITVNPHLAFKGQVALELVRPIAGLLCTSRAAQDNTNIPLLAQFEALMAITNLASMDDTTHVRDRIVAAGAVKAFESLIFDDNVMVRRAAVEAICNMMFHPAVYEAYADAFLAAKVPTLSNKLKLLVALSDSEDFATRRAASGAVAILSSSPNACHQLMALVDENEPDGKKEDTKAGTRIPRGLETVVRLLEPSPSGIVSSPNTSVSEDDELHLRGLEIVKNLANIDKASQNQASDYGKQLAAAGVIRLLKRLISSQNEAVAQAAGDALQALARRGIDVLH